MLKMENNENNSGSDAKITRVPYEIWKRILFDSGLSWEDFYKRLPPNIVLLAPTSIRKDDELESRSTNELQGWGKSDWFMLGFSIGCLFMLLIILIGKAMQ